MFARKSCNAGSAALAALALGMVALWSTSSSRAESGRVVISITQHGIPHVRADNFRGLGFGYAEAMADLDLCGLADAFLTFSGRRAEVLGEAGTDLARLIGRQPIGNVSNDFVRRYVADDATIGRIRAALSPNIRDLIAGYAAGYNDYLRRHAQATRPAACRTLGSVRFITADDVLKRVTGASVLLTSGVILDSIYAAAPPGAAPPAAAAAVFVAPTDNAGSNAYAFGREMTGTGAGLLLGNPHFFWDGPDRFVEMHLTIPGVYDAMGVSLLGFPLIQVGFNNSIAWSHTVSTDRRGVVYRLTLDSSDPTIYVVDGRHVKMKRVHRSLRVKTTGGVFVTRSHDFWETEYGPVIASPLFPWSAATAYAFADPNRQNGRLLQQWLEIGTSPSVAVLRERLAKTHGLPWVNTIAADHDGNALYADISVAPNADAALVSRCELPIHPLFGRLMIMMDGSTAACALPTSANAVAPHLLPASKMPSVLRADWVENSNDSYWLANSSAPLTGFSPIIGREDTPRNFRTRQGTIQVDDRRAGRDGFSGTLISPEIIEQMLVQSRSVQAELVMGDLLAQCEVFRAVGAAPAVLRGCSALSGWDGHYGLHSRGAHLFATFAEQLGSPAGEDLSSREDLWRTPFESADPVHTPRGFRADLPAVRDALGAAVDRLEAAGVVIDQPLGAVQFVTRFNHRIPVWGGSTFSSMHLTLVSGVGFTEPVQPSNSYIQVVTFDAQGPVADAILGSSQSPDAESPYYADQTRLYSQGRWVRLPYHEADIAAQLERKLVLRLPP